jgi:hypothetical protein
MSKAWCRKHGDVEAFWIGGERLCSLCVLALLKAQGLREVGREQPKCQNCDGEGCEMCHGSGRR